MPTPDYDVIFVVEFFKSSADLVCSLKRLKLRVETDDPPDFGHILFISSELLSNHNLFDTKIFCSKIVSDCVEITNWIMFFFEIFFLIISTKLRIHAFKSF